MLEQIESTISGVAAEVGPSVVGVGRRGSGVIVGDGRVLTVAHAVRSETPTISIAGEEAREGRIAAIDARAGVAAVATDTAGRPPLEIAGGEVPALGAVVLALADPGGRGLRATLGTVTSGPVALRARGGRGIAGAIEHSAPLPRGSSGGPLVTRDGALIGLNAVRSDGGLLLALPLGASLAGRLDALFGGEIAPSPYLGLALAPAHVARRLRRAVGLSERDGALVRGVVEGGPADRAGLVRGDLLIAAAGTPVGGIDDVQAALDGLAPGDELELGIDRAGEERSYTVTLGDAEPAEARR